MGLPADPCTHCEQGYRFSRLSIVLKSEVFVLLSPVRFFECERQCDADPCCTGFGLLNESQTTGIFNEAGFMSFVFLYPLH